MSPVTRSNRDKRSAENQEDIKHILEEVWDFDPDETFYKIFSRESKKGAQSVIDMSKEELKDLNLRENDDNLSEFMTSEACKVRSLNKYVTYIKVKG